MTVGANIQCTRKCRKNDCGETKSMIKEMVWNNYLQEEGLDKYPEIVKLFDSDSEAIKLVKQALLNDRVLRRFLCRYCLRRKQERWKSAIRS
jgi:hypothetical protein